MMDEGGVEVDGKSDEVMLKVICETDAGGMNHVIRVVPSDVLSTGSSSNIPNERNALKRPKEVSGLCHKLTVFTL